MLLTASEICGAVPEEENQPAGKYGQDLQPEYCQYTDEGCNYASSCLECPFPYCLYEKPRPKQRSLNNFRNRKITRLFESGWKIKELADTFRLSYRTVQRIIKNDERGEDE